MNTWTSNFWATHEFKHQFTSIEWARAANSWIFRALSEFKHQNFQANMSRHFSRPVFEYSLPRKNIFTTLKWNKMLIEYLLSIKIEHQEGTFSKYMDFLSIKPAEHQKFLTNTSGYQSDRCSCIHYSRVWKHILSHTGRNEHPRQNLIPPGVLMFSQKNYF